MHFCFFSSFFPEESVSASALPAVYFRDCVSKRQRDGRWDKKNTTTVLLLQQDFQHLGASLASHQPCATGLLFRRSSSSQQGIVCF